MGDDQNRGRDRADAPAHGVPIRLSSAGAFTPVTDVLEAIEDPQLRQVAHALWQHTANMELRARARVGDAADVSKLNERVADLEMGLVDIRGQSGSNGKLGTIGAAIASVREKVDGISKRAWWLVGLVLGGVGAAAIKLILTGRFVGQLETQVEANAESIHLLQTQLQVVQSALINRHRPAPPPEKASP